MTLTIKHTDSDGTTITGSTRDDGVAEVLKNVRLNWRLSRSNKVWFQPGSRDRAARTTRIEQTKAALEAAGFTVEVWLDNTPRTVDARETKTASRTEEPAAVSSHEALTA